MILESLIATYSDLGFRNPSQYAGCSAPRINPYFLDVSKLEPVNRKLMSVEAAESILVGGETAAQMRAPTLDVQI